MFALLAPVEFRPAEHDIAVLFRVDFKRPNGHAARLFLVIEGRDDIEPALAYLVRKLRVNRLEFQPNLFHTWSWETELVQAIHDLNLTDAQ